jgi:hypothetical protein
MKARGMNDGVTNSSIIDHMRIYDNIDVEVMMLNHEQ